MREKPAGDDRSVMAAVAFAEAGEWDTARRLAAPGTRGRFGAWLERHLVAAALAEAGEHEEAARTLRAPATAPPPAPRPADPLEALLAARGVRMLSGVAPLAALAGRR